MWLRRAGDLYGNLHCNGGDLFASGVVINDVTVTEGCLAVMGPRARDLMEQLCPRTDWSNEAFPFGTVSERHAPFTGSGCVCVCVCSPGVVDLTYTHKYNRV